MALIIGVVSQKGGVGKSTISRLIAREYAANDFNVLIADMDISQSTCVQWNKRRLLGKIQPEIDVQLFGSIDKAMKLANNYDLIIFDGAPHATKQTLEVAKQADMVIIPSGTALDDLEPANSLIKELLKKGLSKSKITLVFNHVGVSVSELEESIEFMQDKGYFVYEKYLPEKTSYRRASDEGKSLTESSHQSTSHTADEVAQVIMNRIEEVVA
ncbi:MAG: ParA family protein [Flammeovirgaceae bacterium]|nr:ParA family protein [Flammeovirgaceae bacterium]